MKRFLGFYKGFHVLIIVTFFLPFITVKCLGPSSEEIETQRIADSSKFAASLKHIDSIKVADSSKYKIKEKQNAIKVIEINSDSGQNAISKLDTNKIHQNTKAPDEDETGVFKWISKILGNLICDDHNNYTGIGMVYLSVTTIRSLTGFLNAFILIILSSIKVFKLKWRNYKRILLYDIIGFAFLSITINEDVIWGFWICFFSWIGLILYDILIFKKVKKSAANEPVAAMRVIHER
jgi:hypothetical protein